MRVAETVGIPLGYATDVDLHADPHLLDGARAMVTLGHDEYWSSGHARRRHRRPRPRRQPGLPRRQRGLPAHPPRRHPARARTAWRSTTSRSTRTRRADRPARGHPGLAQPPVPPPGERAGRQHLQVLPRPGALSSPTRTNWMLTGLVHPGRPARRGRDRVLRRRSQRAHTPPDRGALPLPRHLRHRHRHDFADAIYYTTPSGAGVFESGTQDWVCGMDPYCTGPAQTGHVAPLVDAISTRLFTVFAAGHRRRPSRPSTTWRDWASHLAATRSTAPDVG